MGKNKKVKNSQKKEEKREFDAKTEKVFKLFLKTMSWIGGICFLLVLILPEFNSPVLDKITQIIFIIGALILLSFLFIEMLAERIKQIIEKILTS
jgi:cobalamin synthase